MTSSLYNHKLHALRVFPEAKPLVLENVRKLKQQIFETNQYIQQILRLAYYRNYPEYSEMDIRFRLACCREGEKVKIYQKRLKANQLLLKNIKPPKPSKDKITDNDIYQAKQVPLETLIPDTIRAGSKRLKCCCPLHEEKTPSFVIYEEKNTYYCFGCQAHGDSIEFVMKTENLNFIEAVKKLNGRW